MMATHWIRNESADARRKAHVPLIGSVRGSTRLFLRMATLAATVALLSGIAAAQADAAAIGINFYNSSAQLDPGDTAGAETQTNWNNARFSVTDAMDDSGTPTTLDLSYSPGGGGRVTTTPAATSEGELMREHAYVFGGPQSEADITVSEIPYAEYDLYVYVANGLPTRGIRLSEATSGLVNFDLIGDVNAAALAADPFVYNEVAVSGGTGNYIKLSGLTASSLTLDVDVRPGTNQTSVAGLQFVSLGELRPPTWKATGGGFWDDATNWTSAAAPGGNDTSVFFGDKITADATVVIDGTAVTVKGIEFDNANTYAIAGTRSVNLEADSGNATINVVQGDHEFQAVVNLASNTDVTVAAGASLTFINALNLGGNTLTQGGEGTVTIDGHTTVGGGAVVAAAGALAGTGTIDGDLTVGADFVFDLNDDSDLADGGNPMVVTGRLTLAPWKLVLNGDGRTEAIVPADKFPVFDFGTLATGGLPAGPEDLDGDGVVGDTDLNLLLSSLGTTGGTPGGPGDVTGDGDVNQADLDQLLGAFGNGSTGAVREPYNAVIELGTGTSGWDISGWDLVVEGNQLLLTGISSTGGLATVPEPGSLVLLALGLLAVAPIARRRK